MDKGWKPWEIDAADQRDLRGFQEYLIEIGTFRRTGAPTPTAKAEPVILKPADGEIGPVVLVQDDEGGTGMRQGMGF